MGHRLILSILLLGACGPIQDVPPIDPSSDPRPPGDGTRCAATCQHYADLGCDVALPSPERGISCTERCQRGEEFEAEPHDCIQAADSCEAARACEEDRANDEEFEREN